MSDVFTTRRPMIDWVEFERRLCPPCSTDQRQGEPLAELLRILSGENELDETPISNQKPRFQQGRGRMEANRGVESA